MAITVTAGTADMAMVGTPATDGAEDAGIAAGVRGLAGDSVGASVLAGAGRVRIGDSAGAIPAGQGIGLQLTPIHICIIRGGTGVVPTAPLQTITATAMTQTIRALIRAPLTHRPISITT